MEVGGKDVDEQGEHFLLVVLARSPNHILQDLMGIALSPLKRLRTAQLEVGFANVSTSMRFRLEQTRVFAAYLPSLISVAFAQSHPGNELENYIITRLESGTLEVEFAETIEKI